MHAWFFQVEVNMADDPRQLFIKPSIAGNYVNVRPSFSFSINAITEATADAFRSDVFPK
jgi:hypothetical protein